MIEKIKKNKILAVIIALGIINFVFWGSIIGLWQLGYPNVEYNRAEWTSATTLKYTTTLTATDVPEADFYAITNQKQGRITFGYNCGLVGVYLKELGVEAGCTASSIKATLPEADVDSVERDILVGDGWSEDCDRKWAYYWGGTFLGYGDSGKLACAKACSATMGPAWDCLKGDPGCYQSSKINGRQSVKYNCVYEKGSANKNVMENILKHTSCVMEGQTIIRNTDRPRGGPYSVVGSPVMMGDLIACKILISKWKDVTGTYHSDKITPDSSVTFDFTRAAVECPVCPEPTAWSTCENNKQVRTNYKCDASTNYVCRAFSDERACEVPPEVRYCEAEGKDIPVDEWTEELCTPKPPIEIWRIAGAVILLISVPIIILILRRRR